ncbi:M3 family oligoendopeptidase [Streptococcus sp. DD13]|uniref:M3 family oligoendopeptidase n=1 Tax=Streptococcus sp. DD13 TaxID=1777881 RepID=UPI000797DFFD|nr:M3 family oligoendopeptidase [Streptococcus sp. DD13]KXT78276.1 Oligoendopeptidase F [Streptococcus sp. DD13]
MKFSEYSYIRPNYEDVKTTSTQLISALQSAASAPEALQHLKDIIAIFAEVETQSTLCSIRHSVDMEDSFYDQETDFWNEYSPLFGELKTNYYQAVLDSPFRTALEEALPQTFFLQAENQLKTFSPDAISLFQEENSLVDQYSKLIAGAQIDFQGETYNLSQMIPFNQSTDRSVRQAASAKTSQFYEDNEAAFDKIYDDLVKVRTKIAHQLGFKDYVEYAYHMMNRFDYNRDMVKSYRQEILHHVVPVVQELRKRQTERLGLKELKYYDLGIEFLDGNATPQGDPEFILHEAQKMYQELSPETAEYFNFMVQHELLDLVTKPGKRSGGYCTYLPDFKSPFIFSNFNGTSGDIDVLTHEAGHAFQVFRSRWVPTPDVVWPTYETCEIHSMSMEFLTWPWMDRFFGHQVDKYKYSHLAGTLLFLPYGVLVDHFQHEVYEHPEMTPAERKATWKRLQDLYLPDRDYSDSDFLSRGGFWFRQSHIFSSPFYYIDYTLAQVCALQFWKRTQVEADPTAWEDYIRICDLGGTKTFLQVVEAANLQSPFKEGALESTIQSAADYLFAVDDKAL